MMRRPRNLAGQTLIIALIVLGVLLVIGFVFLGIVSRNIQSAGRQQQRTLAGDLAEAGIRYAHSQLLTSELGADWKGTYTAGVSAKDPDADLIGGPAPADLPNGPDGLGPFTRVNFENGRALIRVRYGPADDSLFALTQGGQASLREPAKAHNYLLIESYGRPGSVLNLKSDPTLVSPARTGNEKKLIALVSIGIVEHARFIDNKYNVSRPAELGVPSNLGIQYGGTAVNFPMVLGTTSQWPDFSSGGPGATKNVDGMGGLFSNADLKVYGNLQVNLAQPMGEMVAVAGNIGGNDDTAVLTLNISSINTSGVWQAPISYALSNAAAAIASGPLAGQLASLDTSNDNFNSIMGVLRDGERLTDQAGFARAIGRKEPPSILVVDPDTGLSRYIRLTRESGPLPATGGANSGRYGYGRGVFVDNYDDRQAPADETGRQNVGTAQSLVYDWLNPNNGQAGSGWQGPFYIPRGAFLKLLSDGFVIIRDSRSTNPFWKHADGTDTGSPSIRYRIGNVPDSAGNPRPYIVNTFTPGVGDINASSVDYTKGQPFNGVIYFEGNVRVRGQIPTDIQVSVVSNATIYIEGSITKGVVGSDYTKSLPAASNAVPVSPGPIAVGTVATRPSTSMLGLFAKDYVALNTTQFFGSSFNQSLEEVRDVPSAVGFNPIRMRTGGGMLSFLTELLLDPASGVATDPSSQKPFAIGYQEATAGTPNLPASLLLTQTSDDGPAPDAFNSLNINPGLPTPPYLFTESGAGVYNSASVYFSPSSGYTTPGYGPSTANNIPMYGLGGESWQRYSKFETMSFPIADPTWTYAGGAFATPGTWPHGTYSLLGPDTNEFQFYPNSVGSDGSNDLLFARMALAPHDIRIEAAIYAEEGSFFVIPGPPFNPNPNDTREAYVADVAANGGGSTGTSVANLNRLENYGSDPDCPFYNEPLDVRIQIIGAVSENMPPPISQQAEWLKRWGWIPGQLGASHFIPTSHTNGATMTTTSIVPNLTISYDPSLGTARAGTAFNGSMLRADTSGRPLPPIPRLPVSPTLAYFGEVNP